jgi:hypothetical protein
MTIISKIRQNQDALIIFKITVPKPIIVYDIFPANMPCPTASANQPATTAEISQSSQIFQTSANPPSTTESL